MNNSITKTGHCIIVHAETSDLRKGRNSLNYIRKILKRINVSFQVQLN